MIAQAHGPGPPGVLLVNVGSPDAPTVPAVRRYLGEFLGDPRVVDLPPLARWLLLHLVILPRRPRRSAAAYRAVWTDAGSPLIAHGRALAAALGEQLPGRPVALGMRYGSPAVAEALGDLVRQGCDRVVVAPLYPQLASSTTGSALEAVYRAAAGMVSPPSLSTLPPFFADPGYIEAVARLAEPHLGELGPDHVLLSFHGLPERHIRRGDVTRGRCLADAGCCEEPGAAARGCYRAQCLATARALADRLGLDATAHSVAFQSRLGRDPWIGPSTQELVPALAGRGVRRLLVLCPSFVADCLETLEEIGLRAAADFRASGGGELRLVPSLNAEPAWVEVLAGLIEAATPRGWRSPPLTPRPAGQAGEGEA